MHTLSLRTVRGVWLIVALSAFAIAHAKTPAKTPVVQVHHVKPVSTQSPKAAKSARVVPTAARAATAPIERGAVIDVDGSRFQYDSCGCGS